MQMKAHTVLVWRYKFILPLLSRRFGLVNYEVPSIFSNIAITGTPKRVGHCSTISALHVIRVKMQPFLRS